MKFSRELDDKLRRALDEDVGSGDATAESIVPPFMAGRGRMIAKAEGVLCGAPIADRIARLVDRKIAIEWKAREGTRVRPGQTLARLTGPYRSLLAAERLMLNFLQRLSGVATLTRELCDRAGGDAGPDILDTRKTTPLWRELERYAVRAGGGVNHRFGLFDMVLIKENHVRAAGTLGEAIDRARAARPDLPLAAEARTLREVAQAAARRVDIVLLDNMTPAQVRDAVRRHRDSGMAFEVSGGVNRKNIRSYARSGVDRISIGALTHSAPALDISMQLYPEKK